MTRSAVTLDTFAQGLLAALRLEGTTHLRPDDLRRVGHAVVELHAREPHLAFTLFEHPAYGESMRWREALYSGPARALLFVNPDGDVHLTGGPDHAREALDDACRNGPWAHEDYHRFARRVLDHAKLAPVPAVGA